MNYKNFGQFGLLLFLFLTVGSFGQTNPNEKLKYLKQESPKLKPEVFAPGVISKSGAYEFGSVFNKAGTEFFYGVNVNGKEEIRYSKLMGKKWSEPKTILSHKNYGYNDPFLSIDENKLYFISQRTLYGLDKKEDYDIWYVERESEGWSEPINAGPNINSENNEYYISFTNEGKMYFSSNRRNDDFDIYSSEFKGGKFQQPKLLSGRINTSNYEADVFVDPNESYIIFCATRPDGLGRGDLYISFKNSDGAWTKSKNMGGLINSKKHELCPFVTKDGKYFFFTSNQDIYWVDATILKNYRD
ncbi:hypothetical protein MTsPCn9_25310 [Croceitalea sp. MTPC9]|uniref:hypothetical protein n=1 Tax=unclassified Croceitalea TaxID=2632280 RepID=UPI002B3B41DD|nr:hypothetical protein MTsPCn6_29220 [Croceitalea sp. MTPC6]GMN17593.1 hypothetical protein MTsPCn9_25310 [Croceitalea sp. MTPC9]